MRDDLEHLTRLLRVELTAVHQQFFHALALRYLDDEELSARITSIDSEDFKNAMQIVDLLVSDGLPIALPSHRFHPGSDITSILRAELQMEEQLADVLAGVRVTDPRAAARRDRAAEPRKAYREWLAQRLDASVTVAGDGAETEPIMAEFLAHLVALVEQPMLHAFLLWHRDNPSAADNAWRLSGAAMLYGTAIVRRGASQRRVPTPATIPAVGVAKSRQDAFDRDMSLVRMCVDLGRRASEVQTDDAMVRLCLRIADDCELIAGMEMDQAFPAVFGRSQVFESFAATRERHL